ncbi:MFS transporter [Micromonospora sp. WMMD882]|uniref:MFS transporter n=1 Tax=Micromonospora sp. WMMD882 TaxID=3015151 RepID=UPI00248AD4B3|nr:MFS transporter [Micromonospora sp. WMMD882]WBB78437.1 MFS transporter [Micromonospora sp. WMMD882]
MRFLRRYVPREPQIRTLAVAAFVDSIGSGLFLALLPVFVVKELHVPATQVGLVVGAASVFGLVSPVPAGHLADRFGAARVWSGLLLTRAACYTGFLFVDSLAQYAVIACLCTMLDRASGTVQQAYVVSLAAGSNRSESMAALRTVKNIGLSVGLVGAGVLIAIGGRGAFLAGFAVNAASYLVLLSTVRTIERRRRAAAAATTAVPAPPLGTAAETPAAPSAADGPGPPPVPGPPSKPGGGPASPLRNRAYVLLSAGNAILLLHDSVLFTLLPLWVITRTSLPHGLVGPLLALNTVLTVAAQVPLTRWSDGVPAARRMLLVATAPLLGACALFAAAEPSAQVLAVLLVAAAVVLLTAGENLHTVGAFELAHQLAPDRHAGRYLGLFNVGVSAQLVFGPPVMTGLVLRGPLGWLGLAAAFAAGAGAVLAGARDPDRRRTSPWRPGGPRRLAPPPTVAATPPDGRAGLGVPAPTAATGAGASTVGSTTEQS